MAEAASAQAPPTFKLVLVGDGGTGKVSSHLIVLVSLRLLKTERETEAVTACHLHILIVYHRLPS